MKTRILTLAAAAAFAAAAVLANAGAAGASTPDMSARASVHRDSVKPTLMNKPDKMSQEQWYSTNPFYGFSYATQSVYFTNGLNARKTIEDMKRGQAIVKYEGKTYDQSNWQAYQTLVNTSDRFQLFGLKRWYDNDTTNNNWLPYDKDKKFLVPAAEVNGHYPVKAGKTFDPSKGFDPNYFSSKADQNSWLKNNKILLNHDPFNDMYEDYTDLDCILGALWMYSDGLTPAPNDGVWRKSWNRVKSASPTFNAATGTSPYRS